MRRSQLFRFLITLGGLGLIVGLVLSFSSHQVVYQTAGRGTIAHYLSSSGTGYLQMDGSPQLYIVHENDFTPAINGIQSFADGDQVSFTYQPDDTTDIDVSSNRGTHLQGSASKVVQIENFTATGGPQLYTTPAYSQQPLGYYQNNWGPGLALSVVGLVLLVSAFFLKRKQQAGFSIAPSMGTGVQPPPNPYQQPMQQPYQQPANPYGQSQYPPPPYAPSEQYQQPQGTDPYNYPPQG